MCCRKHHNLYIITVPTTTALTVQLDPAPGSQILRLLRFDHGLSVGIIEYSGKILAGQGSWLIVTHPHYISRPPPLFLTVYRQVTKSIISLLIYYGWRKFSIIHEELWKNVATSLETQATRNNLTVNHVEMVFDNYKCCRFEMDCCRSGYWYTVLYYYMNN